MEIRNLITFQYVYKHNSFSRAASELGYSQSAVTMQIKQLENELQVKLFDRVGKKVDVTNAGRRFLKYAEDIITSAENAVADLTSDSSPSGILRIGILESVCTTFLPEILSQYHLQYPQVSTIIKIGTFDELSLLLHSNSIDLLWTFDKPIDIPEWVKAHSYDSTINIVCSPKHKLIDSDHATLSDISNETFILTEKSCSYRRIFQDYMLYLGYQPNIFLEIGNTDIIKKFVQADLGITLLPYFTLKDELQAGKLKTISLSDYELKMQGQIFYHKNKWVSPALQTFLTIVKASL